MTDVPPPPAGEIRFLALGDSYTIGEAVEASARWPVRLAALLRARGIAVAEPQIVAQTGWTTDELSAGIDAVQPNGVYDIVSLQIGVNNQYRGRGRDEYADQFRALLKRAIAFAGDRSAHVVVLSTPDWGVTPFAEGRDRATIGQAIDEFNAVARQASIRAGVGFVDVTPISRRAATEPGLIARDGLHPSSAMYDAWAALVLPTALAALAALAATGRS